MDPYHGSQNDSLFPGQQPPLRMRYGGYYNGIRIERLKTVMTCIMDMIQLYDGLQL